MVSSEEIDFRTSFFSCLYVQEEQVCPVQLNCKHVYSMFWIILNKDYYMK